MSSEHFIPIDIFMPSKQQKLDAIYEAMADKTLSDGCIFLDKLDGSKIPTQELYEMGLWQIHDAYNDIVYQKDEYKIIWHPVHIGDVIDYWDFEGTEYALLKKWQNKRLPIDDQSDECIDFVYSLITK